MERQKEGKASGIDSLPYFSLDIRLKKKLKKGKDDMDTSNKAAPRNSTKKPAVTRPAHTLSFFGFLRIRIKTMDTFIRKNIRQKITRIY